MRWFKVAAIAAGVVIAFLVVSSVIGFLMEAAIAALVVATVVLAVKVAFYRGQVRPRTGRTARSLPGSAAIPICMRHLHVISTGPAGGLHAGLVGFGGADEAMTWHVGGG